MTLQELAGSGWTVVEPPRSGDDETVVARYDGEPIRAGVLMDRVTDTSDEFHARYRTGQYNLDVKVDFVVGRGQIRVERADGYSEAEA